jgi:hypothetical protein
MFDPYNNNKSVYELGMPSDSEIMSAFSEMKKRLCMNHPEVPRKVIENWLVELKGNVIEVMPTNPLPLWEIKEKSEKYIENKIMLRRFKNPRERLAEVEQASQSVHDNIDAMASVNFSSKTNKKRKATATGPRPQPTTKRPTLSELAQKIKSAFKNNKKFENVIIYTGIVIASTILVVGLYSV